MDTAERKNHPWSRCFIVAPPGVDTTQVAAMLNARGIACFRAEDFVKPGVMITEEVLRLLVDSDFVVAFLQDDVSRSAAFELGFARALHKPILVFTEDQDNFFSELRGMYTVRGSLAIPQAIGPDMDRFLRHAAKSHAMKPSAVK